MSTTAGQKIAVLLLPVAAAGLGIITAGPDWTVGRSSYRSMKESLERQAAARLAAKEAEAAAAALPVEPATPPAPRTGRKKPQTPAPAKPPEPGGEAGTPAIPPGPKEPGTGDAPPATGKAALPAADGIEFKVSGLCSARSGLPLRDPAADRLDLTVTASGAPRIGAEFSTPEMANEAIKGADAVKKEKGVLYLIPNKGAPWDAVRDFAAAGAMEGWARIALCVGHPDSQGQGRVLALSIPSNEVSEPPKGVDIYTVRVVGAGPFPTYAVNGDACKDAAALEAKVKGLHEEYEASYEGYTAEVDKTPWVLDGSGALSGGVVAALDALLTAGVKTVRLPGFHRPVAPR